MDIFEDEDEDGTRRQEEEGGEDKLRKELLLNQKELLKNVKKSVEETGQ